MPKLYAPELTKDSCGFGLIANIEGRASHKLVRNAITGLARMQHRGAILADGKTGDGCGISLQMPQQFFQTISKEMGLPLPEHFAVGMVFFPQDKQKVTVLKNIIQQELEQETLPAIGWREVPINKSVLGDIAASSLPWIQQIFIAAPPGWKAKDVERRLFMARRRIEKKINDKDFYICSLSTQILIYKGLCMPSDLPLFYLDLADIRLQSAIVLFHQRFSTNTSPRWSLAQPFRYLAHNGEINTISGNRAWTKARSYKYKTPLIPDLNTAFPLINEHGSDSSSLDNMFEVFVNGGMDIFRAMRLLIPPAWQNNPDMDDDLRAFYSFNSIHMEPWDGPAGVVFSDGRYAACTLDRNGLRPARYVITSDQLITISSEIGIWDYSPDEVVEKGRIGPGELLVIDTKLGKLLNSELIDAQIKSRHPYQEWLKKNVLYLRPYEKLSEEADGIANLSSEILLCYQKVFGMDLEELESVLRVLAEKAQEATGSMGDDAPLAVLSRKYRSLYDYFRQYFAQVTNPPIDPLREAHVMSLSTHIGSEMSVFYETEGMSHRVSFSSPVLLFSDFDQLLQLPQKHYRYHILDATFDIKQDHLQNRLQVIAKEAQQAVKEGAVILVISDKKINKQRAPIPAPLSIGIIQQHLADKNLRCDCNIIMETGSARNSHQFAVLLSLGATAIYPYLVYESLAHMVHIGAIKQSIRDTMLNYRNGINKGLYKIISKMGISTISSYRCARLFEVIGLDQEIMAQCLAGMVSRIAGKNFAMLQKDIIDLHQNAWRANVALTHPGFLKYKPQGEAHAYHPEAVKALQIAVRSGSYDAFKHFQQIVDNRGVLCIRDLLKLKIDANQSININDVVPADNLYSRFDSAAMSIGALSPEAHEAIAIAMNRLGGFSNSGEGGEDPKRYGTEKRSKIKQIASGRFGVTPAYLINAEVIQIKIAQGAKPGEGGQLPGDKVTPYIAQLRHAVSGTTLISPPPHHDIYSIEDLAQLIFDLKQINPKALISVKLVSSPGVGTIACGVVKAHADLITISGYDGGTGASPLTSVKHAGSAWELGLAETQQALVENNLRHKVRIQVDGGLKTGLDIIKAAILGAETFGFGTAPMIALGCKYLRICHLNNCATGIATQDNLLRNKHYHGLPELVMNYFRFIAQDVRRHLAFLGVKNLTDLIGRTDLLERSTQLPEVDLSALLYRPKNKDQHTLYCSASNQPFDQAMLNQKILEKCEKAVKTGESMSAHFPISNVDRSVSASLSGLIAQQYGNKGKAQQRIELNFIGTAGQSFGAFLTGSLYLTLTGDANDYVGKGMAGGCITIKPHPGSAFIAHETTIMGNTCLYGATGGKLFAAGKAGERFAVRNSGSVSVVEGIADNGCEYMTGGVVCILGKTGVNFGAGMTGGFAYIYNREGGLEKRLNKELVENLSLLDLPIHQEHLRGLIAEHTFATGSELGEWILDHWNEALEHFVLVKPTASDVHSLLGHRWYKKEEMKMTAH